MQIQLQFSVLSCVCFVYTLVFLVVDVIELVIAITDIGNIAVENVQALNYKEVKRIQIK